MKVMTAVALLASSILISNFAQASDPDRVNDLKGQIVALAQTFQGQGDVNGSKKQALEVLISQLLPLVPERTMAEKAKAAVGTWHEVWGPYHGNDARQKAGLLDPSQIYQVIFENNTYMNVGVYRLLGHQMIDLLKGQYTLEDNQISIQFVSNGIVDQAVPAGKSLADLPALEEAGQLKMRYFPKALPPVGIRGALKEIYADDTIRLTYGVQEGKSSQTLYVLERVATISN